MPVHVNQFSAEGRFPNGKPSRAYDCTVAVGMMALDDFTGGAIRPSATEFRRRQNDQAGGIGLDDVAVVWKTYGLTFTHGPKSWGTIMTRLRAGRPVALQGLSGSLGPYAVGRSVPHAIYATRASAAGLTIHDPLRSSATTIPETYVKRFYVTGLALAGWGVGTYAGRPSTPTLPPDAADAARAAVQFINIPEGKILTRDDIDYITTTFKRAGFFAGDVAGLAEALTSTTLMRFVGQPWNKATRDAMQAALGASAVGSNPLGGLGASIGDIGASISAGIGEGAFVLVVGGLIVALFVLGAWRLTSK